MISLLKEQALVLHLEYLTWKFDENEYVKLGKTQKNTCIVFMSPSRNRRIGNKALLAQLFIKSRSAAPTLNSACETLSKALPKK